MLKKLYDKSKILFALTFIAAYCVLMSTADFLSDLLGVDKLITLAIGLVLCAVLFLFLKKNSLLEDYGLCLPKISAREMLYYIPLVVMLSANIWYGLTLNYGTSETALYILSMLCVGFLEEVIFRGLLFEALRKDSIKTAVVISSVTFGIGHIINLINGSGAQLLPNLLQVVYATSAGFMFVMIYLKSRSLIICIASHGIFNALSVFANDGGATSKMRILSAVFLTVITGGYAVYIALTMKRKNK